MDDRLSYLVLTPDAEFVTDEIVRRHEAGYRAVGEAGLSGLASASDLVPKDLR